MNGFCIQKTNFPFICCIVDDASTDGEQEIIRLFIKNNFDFIEENEVGEQETDYANILVGQHKKNRNCFFTVLLLKENLYSKKQDYKKLEYLKSWRDSCKYEALCEGDDYWIAPTKLQKQVDFLESHPDYTAVIHNAERVSNGKVISRYDILPNDGQITPEMAILGGGDFCATNSILYRSEILRTAPKEVFNQYVGDYPLQMYLTFAGKVHYFAEVMSAYRVNAEGSWSQKNMKPSIKIRKPLWEKEAKLYRDMNMISGGKYKKIFHKKKYESLLWDAKRCGSWYYAFLFWIKLGAPLDNLKLNYIPKLIHSILRRKD